jgi:hypothetical protein
LQPCTAIFFIDIDKVALGSATLKINSLSYASKSGIASSMGGCPVILKVRVAPPLTCWISSVVNSRAPVRPRTLAVALDIFFCTPSGLWRVNSNPKPGNKDTRKADFCGALPLGERAQQMCGEKPSSDLFLQIRG